jgi:glutamyl-tRNA reductase
MSILLVGLNHHTAPVEIREQLAFSRDGAATALMLFRNQFPQCECSILSTCNRVEVLVASDAGRPTIADVVSFLAQARDLPADQFRPYLYQLTDERACRHFFRVASGLDSMVLGESQIVSQIKQSYAIASEQGTTGRVLNRMFHHAFSVSKRVRSETEIGAGKVSVPSVAVEVAKRIFDDFTTKQVLVVGAGEMAQLVCEYLREADARKFVVTTRTLSNAKALAEACAGTAVPFDQLDEQLIAADIVIAATACPTPFLTASRIREAQHRRHGRLLFLIDLAVPRNVEPETASIDQVYVHDIDALGRIVAENQQHRISQIEVCERILDEEVAAFEEWLGQAKAGQLISQMYADAREVRDMELRRLFRRCSNLSDEQRELIEQSMERLVNKFMHPCVSTVRRHSLSGPTATLAGALHGATMREGG